MTAFAFNLERDHLSVASDTVSYELGAETRVTGFTSKVFVVPRLRMMLCGRGVLSIAAQVHARLAVAPVADFAAAVELLPELLREVTDEWAADAGVDDPGDRQVFEALFGGFDREMGRARLFLAVNYRDDFQPEEYPAGAGIGCIPSLPADLKPDIASLPARDRLMSCMRAAREYFLAEARGVVVGGEIELTVISAGKVSCRPIGHLPVAMPDRTALSDIGNDDPLAGLVKVAELKTPRPAPPRARPVSAPAHRIEIAAGAGLGAGLLTNSLLGGNKLGGSVGSATGALTGALIGSLFGPTGTLIGGILGGTAGGGFGGPLGRDTTTIASGRIDL